MNAIEGIRFMIIIIKGDIIIAMVHTAVAEMSSVILWPSTGGANVRRGSVKIYLFKNTSSRGVVSADIHILEVEIMVSMK